MNAGRQARVFLLATVGVLTSVRAWSQSDFLPANDARLRADVLLLVDEGVISLPTNAWPIPRGDVAAEIERIDSHEFAEPALMAALARVRGRVIAANPEEWRLREASLTAGEASLLRSFGTLGRDAVELSSSGGMTNDRWSVIVAAKGVASPTDDKHLRLDGSNLSLRWGNWLLSANQLDRWWGPGWDGSLVLSTNARPMPALSLDRLRSSPFDFPLLHWLGPWRFSAFLAQMEEHRPDVERPLFMGMRVSFKPVPIMEFALSRTAQFCGKGRPCGAKTFWNVMVGNDNAGLRVAPEDEPGNQMAGIDLRIVSPARAFPFAIYGQFIGEDNSSNGIPERYLGQVGLESWALLDSGASLRWHIEYANTNCKFAHPGSNPDCAYRQGIFHAGYRYRRRNIGHTADSDSEMVSVAVEFTRPAGETFSLGVRQALLDRYGDIDGSNSLTAGPGKVRAVEAGWQGTVIGQSLAVTLGYERREQGGRTPADQLTGFVSWTQAF